MAPLEFRISGTVVEQGSERPLPALIVRAYSKDIFYDDLLGRVTTDQSGHFELHYRGEDFRDLIENRPDIYFSIWDSSEQNKIHSTDVSVRWGPDADVGCRIEVPAGRVSNHTDDGSLVPQGEGGEREAIQVLSSASGAREANKEIAGRRATLPLSRTGPEQKPPGKRTKIFISYSHKDVRWLDRLHVHLKHLERSNEITGWDDTLIKPGEKWREAIRSGLEDAKVAVLLISADFLASDFINSNELPSLLASAESEGVVIFPILVSPSRFEETTDLSMFQAVNPPSHPLNAMTKTKREAVFVRVSRLIEEALRS